MGDKLQEMFDKWKGSIDPEAERTEFQAFQGGVTAGAVSMRERAMALAGSNKAKNAIGQLSDIP